MEFTEQEKKYWADVMEIYAAMIDRMDQGIGKVIKALEQQNVVLDLLIRINIAVLVFVWGNLLMKNCS